MQTDSVPDPQDDDLEKPVAEKKKRGRKHKPRVYKVTKLDNTITLFSDTPSSNTEESGTQPIVIPKEPMFTNEEPSIIHLSINGAPSSLSQEGLERTTPRVDYKKKIILPEQPDNPITEQEYNESLSKREKETTGLEKYINLNGSVTGKFKEKSKLETTESFSRLDRILQFLEDPSITTTELKEIFTKIKSNLDLDAFLSSNNFETQTHPKFETLLDDTVRQSSYNFPCTIITPPRNSRPRGTFAVPIAQWRTTIAQVTVATTI